ncbi:MAG: hypothetical protein KDJ97_27635 [Anaerolineae bacterium]|nr:hypothetical protein [Anaerolineae bacterium]
MDHNRPIEDYVFARIELEDRLHRLTGVHYDIAIFRLCGFSGREVAEIFGYSYETIRKDMRQSAKNEEWKIKNGK